jgi:predicted transglutaminase-like cysteine proteinase
MSYGIRQVTTALLAILLVPTNVGSLNAKEAGAAMGVAGPATAPVGHVAFCREAPAQCIAHGSRNAQILTAERWRELEAANTFANLLIGPRTDVEQHNAEEVWSLPGSYGDCEDYVLLKRKWLVESGWPTGALLIAVVIDEVGEGHAVLVARTDRGDYILDNKTNTILPWHQTRYGFVKRQSTSDPRRWVRVGQPIQESPTSSMAAD